MESCTRLELPAYEYPPLWIPISERQFHPDYRHDIHNFLARTVVVRRSKVSDALGFNIRGGKEHFCGIFLSKVMPNTEAERLGLKEGDQILSVNSIEFLDIEHARAVRILKESTEIRMDVRYFPYGYRKTYEVASSDAIGFPINQ